MENSIMANEADEKKDNSFKTVIKKLLKRFSQDNISQTGGQLAYFFLLSIFPFLIFLNALLGYLNIPIETITDQLARIAPTDVLELLEGYLTSVVLSRNTGLLSLGLITSVYSASKAVDSLVIALNTAYRVKKDRSFIKKKLISLVFTVLLAVTIAIALFLPALGRNIMEPVADFLGISEFFVNVWVYVRWVIVIAALFIAISLLYHIVPYVKLPFKKSIPGTIFATIAWAVISIGFGIYVNNFGNYSAVYGSLGAVIALMFWLYLTGIVLVLGGELNYILYKEDIDQKTFEEAAGAKPDEKDDDRQKEKDLDERFEDLVNKIKE